MRLRNLLNKWKRKLKKKVIETILWLHIEVAILLIGIVVTISIWQNRKEHKKRMTEEKEKAIRDERERIKKLDEKEREEQARKEQLKHLEEMRKQRERELADREVGGGTGQQGKQVEEFLIRSRQLDIQANKEGRGAKQEQPYKEKEKESGLDKLRAFEKSVREKIAEKVKTQEKTQENTRTR